MHGALVLSLDCVCERSVNGHDEFGTSVMLQFASVTLRNIATIEYCDRSYQVT